MDMQQLEYYIECAIFHSMRKVAQLRYCSVSSVSRKISLLERELGVSLFQKSCSGLTLTEKGEAFLVWALQTREEYSKMRDRISPPDSKNPRSCRIACYFFDDTYRHISHLFDFLPSASEGLDYALHIVPLGDLVPQVMNRRFDAGVISKYALKHYPDEFDSIRFASARYKLTLGAGHPLFGRESISAEELLRAYGTDAFFLPGGLAGYRKQRLNGVADLKRLARDYMHEYMHNPGMRGAWLQTVTNIDGFNAEVTFGGKMAITVETISVVNNDYLSSIPFTDPEMADDIALFWRRDTKNIGLLHLVNNL